MNEHVISKPQVIRWAAAAGLLAAGAIAGGSLAGSLSASAAGSSTTGSSSTSRPGPGGPGPRGHGGAQPVRSDENAVSAEVTSSLRAAALQAVPGGTVYRVESDAGDGAYEAHMTKADGSQVTVKFDQNRKVIKVEAGMGAGDPALPGQGQGSGQPQPPAQGSAASQGQATG